MITLEMLLELLEKNLEPCNGCDGEGKREYEYWTNLYEIRTCSICKGSGKRLPKKLRDFMEAHK